MSINEHLTYFRCVDLMSAPRYSHIAAERKLCGNTYLRRGPGGAFIVRFHGSGIIYLLPNGSVTLQTPQQSATTKARMNDYGPAGVHVQQRKHVWYVSNRLGAQERPFFNGIEVGQPTFSTERQAIEHAASQGDELAIFALADLREESAR